MTFRMIGLSFCAAAVVGISGAWAAQPQPASPPYEDKSPKNPPLNLAAHERLITLLGTNDIHGGVEGSPTKDGSMAGGLAYWAGVAQAIRTGVEKSFGAKKSGVLVVDAGDQFQGTLISNFNEGRLVFAAMDLVGYDAVIPGNHDYDFGPEGWLKDQNGDGEKGDPRGALLKAKAQASFPLISASTFLKSSLVGAEGKVLEIESAGCHVAKGSGGRIDWTHAQAPEFLAPWVIKKVAGGVRVALVGIDNPGTPTSTTYANVSDLCFDDEVASYLRARKALEGKADVFVVVTHNGDTTTSFDASKFIEKLPEGSVDAVISGHTHWVTNARPKGVALIQSGSGGTRFGRVDLVYDTQTKRVLPERTRTFAGLDMFWDHCAPYARAFCTAENGQVSYEGVKVESNAKIERLVAEARSQVDVVARRKLGTADGVIKIDRVNESPLANALCDGTRAVAGVDISFLNTGGLRAPLQAGDVTYEDLYKVMPFNNHGVVVGPMGASRVLSLLERSIKTCGAYGALMQSGLRVAYERDCSGGQMDSKAELTHVETLSGEVLLDRTSGVRATDSRVFQVVTLDFLAVGGSGYVEFGGTPLIQDLGIMRERLVESYLAHPVEFRTAVDGRWAESARR